MLLLSMRELVSKDEVQRHPILWSAFRVVTLYVLLGHPIVACWRLANEADSLAAREYEDVGIMLQEWLSWLAPYACFFVVIGVLISVIQDEETDSVDEPYRYSTGPCNLNYLMAWLGSIVQPVQLASFAFVGTGVTSHWPAESRMPQWAPALTLDVPNRPQFFGDLVFFVPMGAVVLTASLLVLSVYYARFKQQPAPALIQPGVQLMLGTFAITIANNLLKWLTCEFPVSAALSAVPAILIVAFFHIAGGRRRAVC